MGGRHPAASAGRLWITTHIPDGRDPWPLARPVPPLPGRMPWLLTELDPADLRPVRSVFVPAIPRALTLDGGGAVWLLADGIRRWTGEELVVPEAVDVAARLDRPGCGSG